MNIQEILGILPHRYPFLMLDRVLECTPGERVIAIKNVSFNEPYFQGHFPGQPIMPGVLLVEAIAQAAAIIAITAHPDFKLKVVYLCGLDGFRFRRPVIPGDQLRITVDKVLERKSIWKFNAVIEVDGKKVADGEMIATVSDPP